MAHRELIRSEAERICSRYRVGLDDALAELVAAIDRRPTLRRLVDDPSIPDRDLARRHELKDAVHDARRHIYYELRRYRRPGDDVDLASVDAAVAADDAVALADVARLLLATHASTTERLDDYPELFRQLDEALPPCSSFVDLGCGLHPLAYLAFGVPLPDQYLAVDRDPWVIEVLNHFAPSTGRSGRLCPRLRDLAAAAPTEAATTETIDATADVAVMMKFLTVLDRTAPDAATRVLRGRQPHAVVTANVESLTRRERIALRERRTLRRLIGVSGREVVAEIDLPSEFGYVLGPCGAPDG